MEKYHDRRLADRVFELAWTHSQVVLRQLNATEADAQLYGRLAARSSTPTRRCAPTPSVLLRNRRGQSGLWGYGISGDLPIVLLRIADPANIELVRQLVQAHAYWRLKGLAVDLVIWNEDHVGYRQVLQDAIMGLIAAGVEAQRASTGPAASSCGAPSRCRDEDRVAAADGGARHPHRQPRHARPSRSSVAARAETRDPDLRRSRRALAPTARGTPRLPRAT